MSTKINVRSPFYINITEPTEPTIELTTALINAQGFAVDEYGNITLPVLDFGTITSYTSSAGDFSNGKFAAVGTDTSRTVVFTILVPPKSMPKRYTAKPQTAMMRGGRTTQTFVTILHDCQTQQFFLFLEQELSQLF